MKQWAEDTLNITLYLLILVITLPLYLVCKLIDWIKER